MFRLSKQGAPADRRRGSGGRKPTVEGLEERLLLYSTLGGQWAYGSRITYSIAPDQTNVSGVPNVLAQSMASRGISEAQWRTELRRAAAVWQSAANINLAEVADDGTLFGAPGHQQNDPRFGDIRIAAKPMSPGVLGGAFPPPPINGGTRAGDVVLNSSMVWNVGTHYDLQTVAIHEIGHALGLGHSEFSSAVMWYEYNGLKQNLTGDDVRGLRALYGVRQHDWVDNFHDNKDPWNAVNVSNLIDANRRVTLANLDITSNQDDDWFYVQAPSNTSGVMTITMQSRDLSSLSPRFQVYNSALQLVGWTVAPNAATTYGATISLRFNGVPAGTGVFLKAMGWNGPNSGANGFGAYALQADFSGGPTPTAIVAPPNTTVLEQPDQGGGFFFQVDATPDRPADSWHVVVAPRPGAIGLVSRTDTRNLAWEDLPSTAPSDGAVNFLVPSRAAIAQLTRFAGPGHAMPAWFVLALDAALDKVEPGSQLPGSPARRPPRVDGLLATALPT